MNQLYSEHESNFERRGHRSFANKLTELLPGVGFEESHEMLEARTAVVEALKTKDERSSDFIQAVWSEYANVCEQTVDAESNDSWRRAQLQLAVLIHKALIFREVGDKQRYWEDLCDVEEYADNMRFTEIAEAIGAELDDLTDYPK